MDQERKFWIIALLLGTQGCKFPNTGFQITPFLQMLFTKALKI